MSKDTINIGESQQDGDTRNNNPSSKINEENQADGEFSFYAKPIQNIIPQSQLNLLQLYKIITSEQNKKNTLHLRSITDAKQASKYKANHFDYVTPSVITTQRTEKGIVKHSGYICLDFDKLKDVASILEQLIKDEYTAIVFTSPTGNGLKWFVRIDPIKDHKAQFESLANYVLNKYNLVADKSCKDPVRACFIPHDPQAFINLVFTNDEEGFNKLPVFKMEEYPIIKEKIKSKTFPTILINGNTNNYSEKAIENARAIIATAIDGEKHHALTKASFLLGGYVAGGLLDEQQAIAILKKEIEKKENVTDLELAYHTIDKCLENGKSQPITQESLENYIQNNRAALLPEQVLTTNDNRVLRGQFEITEYFLVNNYGLKRNEITEKLESKGKALTDRDINSLYIEAKKAEIEVSKQNFETIIYSSHIPSYHPIKDFFEQNKDVAAIGLIDSLCRSINSAMDPDFKKVLVTKWLVGLAASVFDKNYNPIMLVLIGGKNIGKTEFFRRLLPKELSHYFAQSKFSEGKDSEALMCIMLLILNDELDSLTKYEAKTFRNFISAHQYTYRAPYARQNETKRRLASLCATSNDKQVISDWENNRRIAPIEIINIDKELYNSIDKTALLMEAYRLFRNNFDWALNSKDIELLAKYTCDFKVETLEGELLAQYFAPAKENDTKKLHLTTIQIMQVLESETKHKINLRILGTELRQREFVPISRRINSRPRKVYAVLRLSNELGSQQNRGIKDLDVEMSAT